MCPSGFRLELAAKDGRLLSARAPRIMRGLTSCVDTPSDFRHSSMKFLWESLFLVVSAILIVAVSCKVGQFNWFWGLSWLGTKLDLQESLLHLAHTQMRAREHAHTLSLPLFFFFLQYHHWNHQTEWWIRPLPGDLTCAHTHARTQRLSGHVAHRMLS